MKKSKIFLIAGASVTAVILLIAAYMAFSSLSKASALRADMDKSFTSLKGYYNRNPFPSKGNIVVEQENLENVREWNAALKEGFTISELTVESIRKRPEGQRSSGNFNIQRAETIERLIASKPGVIPEGYGFSFDQYASGTPPKQNDVPRLMYQLLMIESLTDLLLTNNIVSLEAVYRDMFDGTAASGGGSTSPRSRPPRGGGRTTSSATLSMDFDTTPFVPDAVSFERERFGFVFIAKEASLFAILNDISANHPFMMIHDLEFEKVSSDVILPDKSAQQQRQDVPAGVRLPPPSKDVRIVSGPLREAPMRVLLTVDVYTLLAGAEENTGTNAGE